MNWAAVALLVALGGFFVADSFIAMKHTGWALGILVVFIAALVVMMGNGTKRQVNQGLNLDA